MSDATSILIPYLSTRPLKIVARFEGGFGRVLIVQDERGEKHALKLLKANVGADRSGLAAEASILVDIPPHPNLIKINGIVWHEGEPCIVLPAMDGNLRDMIRQCRLTSDETIDVICQVSAGLAHLHKQARVLHLDLKPENILFAKENRFVVSDFGLSAFLPTRHELHGQSELVLSNVVGTVAYMSPEHFATQRMTPKTDVFSLGIIFFELLTARHPFESLTLRGFAERILNDFPVFTEQESTSVPSPIRAICLACLEKNPDNRPSASQILKLLGSKQRYAARKRPEIVDLSNLVNRANSLTLLGRLEESQQILDQCLTENPLYLPAVSSRAELEYSRGHVQQAAEMAETATAIALWVTPTPPGLGTLLVNLANYYLSINPERAIPYARLAIRLDPTDWQARGNLAEACRVFGEARNDQNLLEEGMAVVQQSLKQAPRDLKLLVTYGGILLAKRELQTLGPFVISLVNEFGGDDVFLRFLLIRTFIATGQLKEAETWLAPMRAHEPLHLMVRAAEEEMRRRR